MYLHFIFYIINSNILEKCPLVISNILYKYNYTFTINLQSLRISFDNNIDFMYLLYY